MRIERLSIEIHGTTGAWHVVAAIEDRVMTLRHSFVYKKDALSAAKKFRAFFALLRRK
jgi:hypothetical protein